MTSMPVDGFVPDVGLRGGDDVGNAAGVGPGEADFGAALQQAVDDHGAETAPL